MRSYYDECKGKTNKKQRSQSKHFTGREKPFDQSTADKQEKNSALPPSRAMNQTPFIRYFYFPARMK